MKPIKEVNKATETVPKTTSLKDIRCPVCNGEVNRYYVTGWTVHGAILLCECWSGDLNKESECHLFKVICPITLLDLTEEKE